MVGLRIANAVVPVSVFSLNLILGLSLALAVDYSLLIISRYREEIARSGTGTEALVLRMTTAGRAVLFSSLTLAAAMAALLIFPQRFLYSMGIGGILVAVVSGLAALLVLPAILALLGERVNSLAPARLQRAAAREARPDSAGGWYCLSRAVMRRRVPVAVASATLLIVLGIPFLAVKFTPVDTTVLPKDAKSLQALEALAERGVPVRPQPRHCSWWSTGPTRTMHSASPQRFAASPRLRWWSHRRIWGPEPH